MQNGSYLRLFAEVDLMEPRGKARVEREWLITADYFDRDLPPHLMSAFLKDVDHLTADGVIMALQALRIEAGRRFMPKPADVIAWVQPAISLETQAANMAALIFATLPVGHNHPDVAERRLGPDAWAVVQREGGWHRLCANTPTADKHNFIAQIRPLCLAQMQGSLLATRAQIALPQGSVDAPKLTERQRPMQGFGDILNTLKGTIPAGPQGVR